MFENCGFGFGNVNSGPGGLPLNYGLFSQTGNSTPITNTTSELSLIDGGVGTLSVPANSFKVGDSFSANFSGLLSSLNNAELTINVKSGSVILATSGRQILPSTSNDVWLLNLSFTVRQIGAANTASIITIGTFYDIKQSNGQQQGFSFISANTTTFDTTTSNTLDVTAQWQSASASNSIYSNTFNLQKIF